jgi:hypothetical protein
MSPLRLDLRVTLLPLPLRLDRSIGTIIVANRSYLYSSKTVPGDQAPQEKRRLQGIAEWNYDIPLAFKLLLSGNPRPCRSSIWETEELVAIAGDYRVGVERLTQFLQKIKIPVAQPMIQETFAFLNSDKNKNLFFVLECGEIFTMEDEPLLDQTNRLIRDIKNLEPILDPDLSGTSSPRANKVEKNLVEESINPLKPIYELGLGAWANILYFDLRG